MIDKNLKSREDDKIESSLSIEKRKQIIFPEESKDNRESIHIESFNDMNEIDFKNASILNYSC